MVVPASPVACDHVRGQLIRDETSARKARPAVDHPRGERAGRRRPREHDVTAQIYTHKSMGNDAAAATKIAEMIFKPSANT
jgi:hypothetical protein